LVWLIPSFLNNHFLLFIVFSCIYRYFLIHSLVWVICPLLSEAACAILRSGTARISLLILLLLLLLLLLLGRPLQNSIRLCLSNWIGMKFDWIVPQVNMHQIDGVGFQTWCHNFPEGNHDIILCRKVLPPGEWTCSICSVPMLQRLPVSDRYFICYRVYQKISRQKVFCIGITRGQYYWKLDIGCLAWYRSNPIHLYLLMLQGVPKDFTSEGTLRACLGEIDRCYTENIMPFFVNMTRSP